MTTEISLAKNFQPNQKDHVQWFQSLFQLVKTLNGPMTSNTLKAFKENDLNTILSQNPMGVKIKSKDAMDFPMIHMSLGLRYAEAVLEGRAWIPEPPEA
jgi:hypothetical protein